MLTEASKIKKICYELREDIIQISYRGKVGHVGSALSIIDLLAVLYSSILKIDPRQPKHEERDRFLLSKGHAGNALYVTLSKFGFFNREELFSFCQNGSRLAVHPENTSVPGIEYASGSLGHGFSVATGLALSAKLRKKKFRVFVLLSDAECNEGSVWEAAMLAGQHKLDNLVVIVDYNKMQAMGSTKTIIDLEPFEQKWNSFGWSSVKVDGHDVDAFSEQLSQLPHNQNKPTVFIADTILGKGVSFMEGRLEWHYLTLTDEMCARAKKELY